MQVLLNTDPHIDGRQAMSDYLFDLYVTHDITTAQLVSSTQ